MASKLLTQAFGDDNLDLYTILDVDNSVTDAKLRKAYYKKALIYHPDKNKDDDDAQLKFQAISLAYQILSDKEKRQEYDETGAIYDDDDVTEQGVEQWRQYFRGLFPKVTISSINKFEKTYKKSDEERSDVLRYYKACKGDLNKMITCVMLSEEDDKIRWYNDFILPAIKDGTVPNYEKTLKKTLGDAGDFNEDDDEETESENDDEDDNKKSKKINTKKGKAKAKPAKKGKTTKNSKKNEKEAKEAEDLLAKIRGNALARKERSFNGLLSSIENRYAK